MTGQEIVDQINLELDRIGASGAFSDAELLGFINEGYVDFIRKTESLEKSATTATLGLQCLVSLPTDFLDSRQFRWSYNRQLHPRTCKELDEDSDDWTFKVGTPENAVFYNFDTLRLEPFCSSAGTVRHLYAYIPTELQLSSEPQVQAVWHHAFVDFGAAVAFLTLREYEHFQRCWDQYLERRKSAQAEARVYQRTPNTFQTQRPMTSFNYKYWKPSR